VCFCVFYLSRASLLILCFVCFLVYFELSVPVQVIACKDFISGPSMCRAARKTTVVVVIAQQLFS